MRPVERGPAPREYRQHDDAKNDLIGRLGPYCSYCERRKDPQDLHVEHIYPKVMTAHPNLGRSWRNFLLACSTCNSYKGRALGNGRQRRLLRRYLWPHIDNTFTAFRYLRDGRVAPSASLSTEISTLAAATIELVGSLKSPAVASAYRDLGIAYDGVSKREEVWRIAQVALETYETQQTAAVLQRVVEQCVREGTSVSGCMCLGVTQ